MKIVQRLLIGVCCAAVLAAAWFVTFSAETSIEKQQRLVQEADALLEDLIYIRALPLLEEAVGLQTDETPMVEERLKLLYLSLEENQKYVGLLNKQLARLDATADLFLEASNYYLANNRLLPLLEAAKTGVVRTGDPRLASIYEQYRYAYTIMPVVFEDVTETVNGAIQVQRGGLWGLATSAGKLRVPCEYDKISTFTDGRAIVRKDSEIYAVNSSNYRVNKLHDEAVTDFGNYGSSRMLLKKENGWRLAKDDFVIGSTVFEEIGMFANNHAAAKVNGKWGVIDTSGNFVLPAVYDGVVQDELGRCYAQNRVFVRSGDTVTLYANDGNVFTALGGVYEDAQPFSRENYAAVKKEGQWGFVDLNGKLVIEYQFNAALSFGQHLAAIQLGEQWGYVSLHGDVVIDAVFAQAKSFYDGNAPVCTAEGWQFITLVEFKEGAR